MRILVLGAGATGGYFGGRLAQSGADVTFLVRPARAEALARTGLVIRSPDGVDKVMVRTVTAETLDGPYDVVVLSCKAYGLDEAIAAITPAVGSDSVVVPLLNGLGHYQALDAAFGPERVLGGLCHIVASVGPEGEIIRATPMQRLTFGERAGGMSRRVEALAEVCAKAAFETVASPEVIQAAWEKFSFLAALAAGTCLMRASIGVIMAAGGEAFMRGLYDECAAVAASAGHAPSDKARGEALALLVEDKSAATASMLRDLEAGRPTEGDHILGDMVRRGAAAGVATPLLGTALTHVKAYEIRRRSA
ncbi:MAG: 2-dehydropantoate 2-reductase [Magnetospirillum sp.]|nr:2-dehydropantoate 2-reductase [Magnetospirillum sp.]